MKFNPYFWRRFLHT